MRKIKGGMKKNEAREEGRKMKKGKTGRSSEGLRQEKLRKRKEFFLRVTKASVCSYVPHGEYSYPKLISCAALLQSLRRGHLYFYTSFHKIFHS